MKQVSILQKTLAAFFGFAMAVCVCALSMAPGPAAAQSGCKEEVRATSTLPRKEIDIYTTQRAFEGAIAADKLGPQIRLLDCQDARFIGVILPHGVRLIRRDALQERVNSTPSCVCPSSAADRKAVNLSAPGLGGNGYCPASKCPNG